MAGGAYAGGGDFRVNTTTTGLQTDATVTALNAGGFVLCWTDNSGLGGDASGSSIKAQMFNGSGQAVGAEFLVNSTTSAAQEQASVAALGSGGFVVTWTDNSATGPDPDRSGIKAQIYDASGVKVGGEFLLNTTTQFSQTAPVITGLASGGFVATWVDASATAPDAKGTGVRAQIYGASGAKVGGEFLVNTTIPNSQSAPAIASLASGGFVATWTDSSGLGGDPNAPSVKAQLFSATGTKVGGEFLVNTATISTQDQPSVANLASGGFVIVWRDLSGQGDGSGAGVKGQVYDASGARVGGEFQINTTFLNAQDQPVVTGVPGGGFAVSWRDNSNLVADVSGFGIKSQIFDAQGNKLGGEFQVNTTVTGNQEQPAIAALASGALVVGWADASLAGGDTDGSIRARILQPATGTITDIGISSTVLSEAVVQNTTVANLTANGALNAVDSYQIVDDSTGGAFAIKGSRLVVRDSLALDYESASSATLTIRATDTFGNSVDKVVALTITDSLLENRYGGGNETLVNTSTAANQQQSAIAAGGNGRFAVAWTDGSGQGDPSSNGIKLQLVDGDGSRLGSELLVNTQTLNSQDSPAIAALASGGYVVTWADASAVGGDTSGYGIKAQIVDANGAAVGTEFLVNQATAGAQPAPTVAGLAGGGFVVSWHDTSLVGGDASKDSVKAQLYDASGARVGGEFLVNTQVAGNQQQEAIAGLASGGFVIAWADASQMGGDPDYYGIKLQIYDASGDRVGTETLANTTTLAGQIAPTVSSLADGGFIVSWADYSGVDAENGTPGIKAQIFAANGTKIGEEFAVNDEVLSTQSDPAIAADANGHFAVSWTDYSAQGGDVSPSAIKLRTFTQLGSQGGPAPLIATADTVSGTEDQALVTPAAQLLANDVDSNGLALSLVSVAPVSGGSVALDADGNVVFTPNANFSGTALYTYVVSDDAGLTATGRVSASIAPVNDAPTAVDDRVDISEDGGAFQATVLTANDYDVDLGDRISLQSVSPTTTDGVALAYQNNVLTYAPGALFQALAAGETASDSFTYTVADQAGVPATATVYLNVVGANDAPTGLALSGSQVDENAANGTIVGTLAASDIDHGSVLTYSLTNTAGGRFTVDPGTGIVTVANGALLDYETAPTQNIIGRATDAGGLYVEGAFAIALNNLPEPKSWTGDNGVNVYTARTNDLWTLNGLGGNDVLTGNASADTILGGSGSDTLDGAMGADSLVGGIGNDVYYVDNGGDQIVENYGEGTDLVYASVGYGLSANVENLTLTGAGNINASGNDTVNTIIGNSGDNSINGAAGGDYLQGVDGNDTLYGEAGNDILAGGNGIDLLSGGAGADQLTGGAGADNFLMDSLTVSADFDTIKDFSAGEDIITFSRAVFTAFATTPLGGLPSAAFRAGAAAATADQHIIYNPSTGNLYYDSDGSGSAAMVQVAFLGGKPTLTSNSFMIG